MPTAIHRRVRLAQLGQDPSVIAKMSSGWAVIGETQPLPFYCLLFSDPVAKDLNSLLGSQRERFLADMARLGDVVLKASGCLRINYEILGNKDPALHAHIIPRYADEPPEKRFLPPMSAYDWASARKFDFENDRPMFEALRRELAM